MSVYFRIEKKIIDDQYTLCEFEIDDVNFILYNICIQ